MKDILITSSVLILALLLLRRVFRGVLSRRVQYALWALVLVRLLVPVNLPAVDFSVLTAAQPIREAVTQRLDVEGVYAGPTGHVQTPAEAENEPGKTAPESPSGIASRPDGLTAGHGGEGAARYAAGMGAAQLLRLIWLAGMAVMGSFLLTGNLLFYFKLRKNRREWQADGSYGIHRKVYLVSEGVIPSPCLFGRSIYLTPAAAAAPDRLRHVLEHEETHARHLDPLWSLLRCVCLTVYWFDPLVWVAAACSKTDCELACDEGVLKRLGEEERIPYGETLLSLIPVKRGASPLLMATTMTAGKKRLKDRITRIARKPRQLMAAAVAVAVLAALVSACTFTGGKPISSPAPGKETGALTGLPSPGPAKETDAPKETGAPTDLPSTGQELMAAISLDDLEPCPALTATVERHEGDFVFSEENSIADWSTDGHRFRIYRATDGAIYAAEELDGGIMNVFAWFSFDDITVSSFSGLFGHDGFALTYRPGDNAGWYETDTDYYYFDEVFGVPTLLARCHGESQFIDLNGDGQNELVAPRQMFFRRDGVVYEAVLDALLLDACPELSCWDREKWDPRSGTLCVNGLTDFSAAMWERYLCFDGEALLVYKRSETVTDHVVDSAAVGVSAEVVEQVKAQFASLLTEMGDGTYRLAANEDYSDLPIDDYRLTLLSGPTVFPLGNTVIEVWHYSGQIHTPTPEKFLWVGGSYIDEDGWAGVDHAGFSGDMVCKREGEGRQFLFTGDYWEEGLESIGARRNLYRDLEEHGVDVSPTSYEVLELALRLESFSYGDEITVQASGADGVTLALDEQGKQLLRDLTDPEQVKWSRVEAPDTEPGGQSLILRDSDWYESLQFWEESGLVMYKNEDAPESVWYLAESRGDLSHASPYDRLRTLFLGTD